MSLGKRTSLKRKLDQVFEAVAAEVQDGPPVQQIKRLVAAISCTKRGLDKDAVKKAAHELAELSKQDELIEAIVKEGAIPAVVPLLCLGLEEGASETVPSRFEDIEKEACFILGLLAVKQDHQTAIATAGALKGLVRLLKQHRIMFITKTQPGSGGVARRAADAITNLAHENLEIKNQVRAEGGVPPLVGLLEAWDIKVQRAAAGALRTLAFKNEDNKNMIVDCGALPMLIQMLRSEDMGVHYEAVGVIGNLVHSSQNIKQKVIDEGAMQPVINLLSSQCPESQREAALLLGQFATAKPEYKAIIVQRGAVPPLVQMLMATDTALREMAAFALGRLAQNADNQAGIVQCGGLPPLLELLESKHYNLQHNAAFALYGLADNPDNVAEIIRIGAHQRLQDCHERLQVQASKDCVQKTITRIESKLGERARVNEDEPNELRTLNRCVYMLRSQDKEVQQRVSVSLARLAPTSELRNIFVLHKGLDVILDMLTDAEVLPETQSQAAAALLKLAKRVNATAPIDPLSGPQQPTKTVYLGEQYVNNSTLADVTFIVDGKKFYAHRIALLASSDAFRAMFDSGYREREAASIDIPNIQFDVFHAMMQYIYTGLVEVPADLARQLLQASDQYLLEGLKRLCESSIAKALTPANLKEVLQLSEDYSAPQLGKRCVLFALEKYDEVVAQPGFDSSAFASIMQRMAPLLRASLLEDLNTFVEPSSVSGTTTNSGA